MRHQRNAMRTIWASCLILIAPLIAGCNNNGASDVGDKTSVLAGRMDAAPVNYTIETVAAKIDRPWSIAFLPDDVAGGGMLVTEQTGKLLHIGKDGAKYTVHDFTRGVPYPVAHFAEGAQAGLFDVKLHPGFADNRKLYIAYAAKTDDSASTLVLMRFDLAQEDGKLKLVKGEELFSAAPARTQSVHYGGRMIFLPDGTLLLTTGDAFHYREEAQDLGNHFGKIIRLRDDGSVPADNPFVKQEGARPEIWSYGHRNPQGIILAADGRVLVNEHGPAGGDEINHIEPGRNYGWPTVTYALDYSGSRVSPYEAYPGTQQPLVHFTPSIAPSGFAQYNGDKFPEWQGDLFLSALALKHVRHVEMNSDGSLGDQQELFGELNVRFRDVRSGPDGFMYLLTDEGANKGRVLRVMPKGS